MLYVVEDVHEGATEEGLGKQFLKLAHFDGTLGGELVTYRCSYHPRRFEMFADDSFFDEEVAELLHTYLILVLGRTKCLPPHVDSF